MTRDIAVAITTYKKLEALRGSLDSLENFGRVGYIHIADDNDFEARETAEQYQSQYEHGKFFAPLAYSSGPNMGIARNKNRGIKWFLTAPEAKEFNYLVLVDDDIAFTKSSFGEVYLGDALVKAAEHSELQHITGYLGGSFGKVNPDGTVSYVDEPFFTQFPPKGEDEYLYYCMGTQGILLFFTRALIEVMGYFDSDWNGRYGYEHAILSMRSNRLEGICPEMYPILKGCPNYFHCQSKPNDYVADPSQNAAQYQKKRIDVYNGVGLSKQNPGV